MTLKPPPREATHWTGRATAKTAGLAVSTVQKIWKAHGLTPHRWRRFKLSKHPAFADKRHAVVGLYIVPPAHAVVLRGDEKSQIQALDRTQPGLPLKKGRGGDHDARLQAPRHDHALRGSQQLAPDPIRSSHRRGLPEERAAPTPPEVHPHPKRP